MTRDPNAPIREELRRLYRVTHDDPSPEDGKLILSWRNAIPVLLDEIDAARRFITKHEEHYGPICWRCQVLEERGYCACEIAANE